MPKSPNQTEDIIDLVYSIVPHGFYTVREEPHILFLFLLFRVVLVYRQLSINLLGF